MIAGVYNLSGLRVVFAAKLESASCSTAALILSLAFYADNASISLMDSGRVRQHLNIDHLGVLARDAAPDVVLTSLRGGCRA